MDAEAQALPRRRSVIAAHLIHTLYGHWAANDPRGSGSRELHDEKFAPLGEIHHGRKPETQQPTGVELRAFHRQHEELLNFPLIWMNDAMRHEAAQAVETTIAERGYTCYACAVCRNHLHLVIRTHRDRAQVMWAHFAQSIRKRLRLRFPEQISSHHPVISARPYNVLLYTPHEVRTRISYISANPPREQLPRNTGASSRPTTTGPTSAGRQPHSFTRFAPLHPQLRILTRRQPHPRLARYNPAPCCYTMHNWTTCVRTGIC